LKAIVDTSQVEDKAYAELVIKKGSFSPEGKQIACQLAAQFNTTYKTSKYQQFSTSKAIKTNELLEGFRVEHKLMNKVVSHGVMTPLGENLDEEAQLLEEITIFNLLKFMSDDCSEFKGSFPLELSLFYEQSDYPFLRTLEDITIILQLANVYRYTLQGVPFDEESCSLKVNVKDNTNDESRFTTKDLRTINATIALASKRIFLANKTECGKKMLQAQFN
jgi:hypothetical protein